MTIALITNHSFFSIFILIYIVYNFFFFLRFFWYFLEWLVITHSHMKNQKKLIMHKLENKSHYLISCTYNSPQINSRSPTVQSINRSIIVQSINRSINNNKDWNKKKKCILSLWFHFHHFWDHNFLFGCKLYYQNLQTYKECHSVYLKMNA